MLKVRSEEEIRRLRKELERIVGFIGDYGTEEEFEAITYACDISDALSWVLGEISTKLFLSDSYLDMERLRVIVKNIEKRSGRKFNEYE